MRDYKRHLLTLLSSSNSKVKAWHQKRTLAKVLGENASREPRRWEEDYKLVECEGLFEEYLEMGEYQLLYPKSMMSLLF